MASAASARRLGLPALALALALVFAVAPASALKSHPFKEVFGSVEQPSFPADRSLAVDQGTEDLYVLDSTEDAIYRFNPDGTPANFAALGSNAIDGEGVGDGTPEGNLEIVGNHKEMQLAIDGSGGETDGNIYVTEKSRRQISIFDPEGVYLGELSGHSGGAFNEPLGVAVDEAGNVYVSDFSSADLVHKYEPTAGVPVNGDNVASFNSLAGTSSPGVLAAGAGSTAGFIFVARFSGDLFKLDATTGEIEYQFPDSGVSAVTVDPATGHVLAARGTGSLSKIGRYDASGASEAQLLATIEASDEMHGVAVNGSSGAIYLSRSGTEQIEVYEGSSIVIQPEPTTEAASGLVGTNATLNGSVNPDGVELSECLFEWGPTAGYGEVAPCVESPAEIGSATEPVAVHADLTGLDLSTTYHFRLVADNPQSSPASGADATFTTPDPVLTEPASGVTDTEAVLKGSVNPDGEEPTECFFEWGTTDEYGQLAPCVPGPAGIGSGEEPMPVEASLAELNPGTVYHYRLVAVFTGGPLVGEDRTFQTLGPTLGKTWVEDVVYTEAKLKAEIDPEGVKTTYRFEYGTSEAYGSETSEKLAGSDSSVHEVTAPIAGLTPGTEYHYRVVASSADGVNLGPDRVLRTYERPPAPETGCPNQRFRTGPGRRLSECRAYELVSSPDKEGAIIQSVSVGGEPGLSGVHLPLAADHGEAVAYQAWDVFSEGEPAGNTLTNEFIARRGAGGWSNLSLTPRNDSLFGINFVQIGGYTPDLGAMTTKGPRYAAVLPESSQGSASTLHRRTTPEGVWRQASLNVPGNGGDASFSNVGGGIMSADGTHVVFSSSYDLTGEGSGEFLWREAAPEELTKLPTSLGFSDQENFRHAISADGSRLFTNGGVIVDLGPVQSASVSGFRYASLDGSVAFFEAGNELYRWDVNADELVQITEGADVQAVHGGAEDGSRLYFVGEGALAPGAEAGKPNLYLWTEDGTPDGETAYVATGESTGQNTVADGARFSEDGRYVVFAEKVRSLTGYPNEGNPGLYLYDAVKDELDCVSCIPSGEPAGDGADFQRNTVFYSPREQVVSDDGRVFFDTPDALLPWDVNGRYDAYEYDSEGDGLTLLSTGTHTEDSFFVGIGRSGRDAFFTTAESLVGIDVDGTHDVYDARAGGGLAAQHPTDPPAPCLGEACQNIPAPPELPTPASSVFRGPGDPAARADCGVRARKAARLSRRAKRVRKAAKRAAVKRRSVRLRRRSARMANKAKRMSRGAKRCRRAARRAVK